MEKPSNADFPAAWWRLLPAMALPLGCLALIVWAGAVAWQWPSQADARVLLLGGVADPTLVSHLLPVLVASGFWAAGTVAGLASRSYQPVAFYLVVAGVLATGKLSDMESDVGARLFYLLLAWLTPLTIHFYIEILDRLPRSREQFALVAFSLIAALGSLPVVTLSFAEAQHQPWFDAWRASVRLGLVLAFLLSAFWLAQDYRQRASVAVQRRIRLVAFATLFAFAPMFLLSLLPDTLGAPAHFPYELTFPWLMLSPLAYGYAQLRHRLVRTEYALSRAIILYLTTFLLLSMSVASVWILDQLGVLDAPGLETRQQALLVGGLSIMVAALAFASLQKAIRPLVNWVLYGHEMTDAGLVERFSASLARTLDLQTLRQLLVEELAAAMGFSRVSLFVRDKDQALLPLGAVGFGSGEVYPDGYRMPSDGVLATVLERVAEPVRSEQLFRALAGQELRPEERSLLSAGTELWLPLVSDGVLQGLLLIGVRPGDAFFTAEDLRVLSTISRQAGIAAHNLWLLESVRANQEELARMHRHLSIGREQERLRLARELHDGAVQQLLGVSRLLDAMRPKSGYQGERRSEVISVEGLTLQDLRQEILKVVRQLREMSGELRPAWLRELGLTAALRSETENRRESKQANRPQFDLDLDESGTALPEPITICLFRVAQEALRNATQHAGAHRIELRLRVQPDAVVLQVRDDGQGFRVPDHLSELTQAGHFGLAGMVEQVEWLRGTLVFRSQPGAGTEITARVPLGNQEKQVMT